MGKRERAVIGACFGALLSCACSASGVNSSMGTGGRSNRGTGGSAATSGDATGGAGEVTVACNANLESTGCTPGQLVSTASLSGPYGTAKISDGTREYQIQINEWGASATQKMSVGGSVFFAMTQQDAALTGSGAPAGYPSAFIGANSGHSTANSGLPKQVSALGQVPTTWSWAANGAMDDTANNVFNATYDVWFSTNAGGDPAVGAPSGGYLMVWYYAQGCQPIGKLLDAGHTISSLPGCWDVWGGLNNGKPVISFKHQGPLMSFGFDLNLFIQDALNNYPDYMNASWYLSNIFTGFEIWKGGGNLESTSFCAEVN